MAFREVHVHEIREVLRVWLRGESLRSVERLAALDRKTVRRYVAAAEEAGLDRSGGESQLTDELIARVCESVRRHRGDGHGSAWALVVAHHDEVKGLVEDSLTVRKIHELLGAPRHRRSRADAAPLRASSPWSRAQRAHDDRPGRRR